MSISEPFIRRPIATALLIRRARADRHRRPSRCCRSRRCRRSTSPPSRSRRSLPGASPDTMAATVAAPLERQFGQIAGVTQMTSTSTLGSTSITLQFELTRNVDAAAQDVQAAITAAGRQLPQTLSTPPTYRKVNPADSPILVLAAHSDSQPLTTVDDIADNVVAQQISQITGVAQVIIGGEQKPRSACRSIRPRRSCTARVYVDPSALSPETAHHVAFSRTTLSGLEIVVLLAAGAAPAPSTRSRAAARWSRSRCSSGSAATRSSRTPPTRWRSVRGRWPRWPPSGTTWRRSGAGCCC